ncbi:hypothetical protein FQS61_16125 [Halomonas sp. SBBP1]|nr:hypothetical protein [Halomonas sp. SBBP1]
MMASGVGVSLVPTLALVNKLNADIVTRPFSPNRTRHLIAFWPKKKPLIPVGRQLLRECCS